MVDGPKFHPGSFRSHTTILDEFALVEKCADIYIPPDRKEQIKLLVLFDELHERE